MKVNKNYFCFLRLGKNIQVNLLNFSDKNFIDEFEKINFQENENENIVPLLIFDDTTCIKKLEDFYKENKKEINLNENFIYIFNNLLFNSVQKEYKIYKKKNIKKILENKIKPDLIIESLMQINSLLDFIFKNEKFSVKEIRKNFFSISQKQILYFFKEDNSAKCYRKRLLTHSTEKVNYIPFITRDEINAEVFDFLYGNRIDILLQRAPYFYLESENNKNFCMELENFLTLRNLNNLKMSSFKIIEKLFLRHNCYLFIKDFINKNSEKIKEKFNISIEVPFSIDYHIDQKKLNFLEIFLKNETNYDISFTEEISNFQNSIKNEILEKMKETNMQFPIVIKPDQCEVHEMMLIINEFGLVKFVEKENFKKLFLNKSFILQKFVNHDGLMFKNFFINKKSYTFIRPSLPNLEGKNLELKHFKDNCFTFKNEFLYGKEDESFWNNIENSGEDKLDKEINYDLINEISEKFANDMDLNLFGLDYLFDRINKTYYLLECNYFPSYRELKEKLAGEFESHMITYHNEYLNRD